VLEDRPLVFIPTYNEKGNIVKLYNQLKRLDINLDLLFIDDCSPDGSGQILDQLASQDNDLNVIHRRRKLGIGSAHKEGIAWAYSNDYKILITMDSDFSHSPDKIEDFIRCSKENDVVVGNRYMHMNSMADLSIFRRVLSVTAHAMTNLFLRMPYDATNAYRLYRLDKIDIDLFEKVESDSYSYFFESLYVLYSNKISITEVPIKIGGRSTGDSKMTFRDALISIKILIVVTFKKYFKGL
jgi:dolichol-phosphate mannosyltransferase